MASRKSPAAGAAPGTRARILAAAEQLLATGRPEFSMRDLAAEAEVSFATPFNQFGNKAAIILALSSERIAAMHTRFAAAPPAGDAVARILAAVAVAAAVMLEQPAVNRAVMGALGAPGATPGEVLARSRALWAEALDEGDGLTDPALARAVLPDQLAIAFRGVLSFWTAGEIADHDLTASAQSVAAIALLGFAGPHLREKLSGLMVLRPEAAASKTR